MKHPAYSKAMREQAQAKGQRLLTFSVTYPSGKHMLTSSGPICEEGYEIMFEAWIKAMELQKKSEARK